MEASRAETRTGFGGAATAVASGAGATAARVSARGDATAAAAALAVFSGAAVAVTDLDMEPFFATVAVVFETAGLTVGLVDDGVAVLATDGAAALTPDFAAGLAAGFTTDFVADLVVAFTAAFGRAGAGAAAFLRAGAVEATLVVALTGALGLALTTAFFTLTFAVGFLVWAFTVCLLGEAAAAWAESASTEPLRSGDWWSSIMRFIPLLLTFEGGVSRSSPARDCIGLGKPNPMSCRIETNIGVLQSLSAALFHAATGGSLHAATGG